MEHFLYLGLFHFAEYFYHCALSCAIFRYALSDRFVLLVEDAWCGEIEIILLIIDIAARDFTLLYFSSTIITSDARLHFNTQFYLLSASFESSIRLIFPLISRASKHTGLYRPATFSINISWCLISQPFHNDILAQANIDFSVNFIFIWRHTVLPLDFFTQELLEYFAPLAFCTSILPLLKISYFIVILIDNFITAIFDAIIMLYYLMNKIRLIMLYQLIWYFIYQCSLSSISSFRKKLIILRPTIFQHWLLMLPHFRSLCWYLYDFN
jgi:hypothetical protein